MPDVDGREGTGGIEHTCALLARRGRPVPNTVLTSEGATPTVTPTFVEAKGSRRLRKSSAIWEGVDVEDRLRSLRRGRRGGNEDARIGTGVQPRNVAHDGGGDRILSGSDDGDLDMNLNA